MNYSNPRKKAIIEDWPIGRNQRGTCIFEIETTSRGQRCLRRTEKANGTWGKDKKTTYGAQCRIVDGDDGKTYVITHSDTFGMISVMQSNLKYSEETIHESDERYAAIVALFNEPCIHPGKIS